MRARSIHFRWDGQLAEVTVSRWRKKWFLFGKQIKITTFFKGLPGAWFDVTAGPAYPKNVSSGIAKALDKLYETKKRNRPYKNFQVEDFEL